MTDPINLAENMLTQLEEIKDTTNDRIKIMVNRIIKECINNRNMIVFIVGCLEIDEYLKIYLRKERYNVDLNIITRYNEVLDKLISDYFSQYPDQIRSFGETVLEREKIKEQYRKNKLNKNRNSNIKKLNKKRIKWMRKHREKTVQNITECIKEELDKKVINTKTDNKDNISNNGFEIKTLSKGQDYDVPEYLNPFTDIKLIETDGSIFDCCNGKWGGKKGAKLVIKDDGKICRIEALNPFEKDLTLLLCKKNK